MGRSSMMMYLHFASMAVLAVAVSLDSFGVGITYGLRKITIPFFSIIIISLCSGAVIGVSMQAGNWLSTVLSPEIASKFGASILIGIGLWAIYQYYCSLRADSQNEFMDQQSKLELQKSNSIASPVVVEASATLFKVELKRLGLVIQILRTPQTADFDSSGNISSSEAIMLGIALSLDAFGAGIGAALLGLHPIWTPCIITVCSAMFLVGGTQLGKKLSHLPIVKYLSGLPGILLIVLGILKFF